MMLDRNRHMDADQIESYSMGTLPEKERDRLEEHLLVCEVCRNRVEKSDNYVAAMQEAAKDIRMRKRQWTTRRFLPRMIPLLSAASLLALAVVGLRYSGRGTSPAFAVNLEATRGAGIDAHAPAGRGLLLTLGLSGLPAQASYRVEVVDRLGKVVWQGNVAARDSTAAASLPGLPAGVYFVRIYSSAGDLLREFGLAVEVVNRS